MKSVTPPRLATWLVSHAVLGDRNEALVGDLQEEFQTRRSRAWYWRQVFGAILSGFANEWRREWSASGYAVLWTVPIRSILDNLRGLSRARAPAGTTFFGNYPGNAPSFCSSCVMQGGLESRCTSEIPIALYLVTLCIGLRHLSRFDVELQSREDWSCGVLGWRVAALLVGQVAEGFLVRHIFLVARLVDWFGWDLYLHGFDWITFFVALLLSMWTANPNWRSDRARVSPGQPPDRTIQTFKNTPLR